MGAAALCLAGGLASCLLGCQSGTAASYACPFDWSSLKRDGDRLSYASEGQQRSLVGVDVSSHQGTISWNAVAADGIDFALIRIGNRGYTEGALYADDRFAENIDGAAAAGLACGAYFFSQALTPEEAREEAEFSLSLLAGRYLPLPVAFDHEPIPNAEGRANGLSREALTACAEAFCARMEQGGYGTMIYGNAGDMARFCEIDGTDAAARRLADALGGRPVWFAEYGAATPQAQFDFALWQYTNEGRVNGIGAPVDLNLLLLDAEPSALGE